MSKFVKIVILFMYSIITYISCSINAESDFKANLLNPEQTNQTRVAILSVDEAKDLVIRQIIESGYALTNRWLLQENPYLTNITWGPVIFVENISKEGRQNYYYIFYGKMPDGAVAVDQAVDAETGELFRGGLITYNDTNKVFIMQPNEAKNYAVSKAGISENVIVKAVFYRDWSTMNYDETFCWKYQIMKADNTALVTKGQGYQSIFLDPYIVGTDSTPTAKNVINRFFSTRIYALQSAVMERRSMYTKGMVTETNIRFVSIE